MEYRIENSKEQKIKSFDFFISHSSNDYSLVQSLIQNLNEKKCNVYCDWISDTDYLKRKLVCEATLRVIEKRIEQSKYEYFRVARELIKDLPIEKIECASELIELATKVLNNGLRPHLTKWQARYRKWYESSVKESDAKLSPQDIQKQYPYYDELLSDLIETK